VCQSSVQKLNGQGCAALRGCLLLMTGLS